MTPTGSTQEPQSPSSGLTAPYCFGWLCSAFQACCSFLLPATARPPRLLLIGLCALLITAALPPVPKGVIRGQARQQSTQAQQHTPPPTPEAALDDSHDAAAITTGEAQTYVLFVLDASHSMAEQLPSGETKMQAAKKALMDTLASLPPDTYTGLRVYGHTMGSMMGGVLGGLTAGLLDDSCRATQLIAPFGQNQRQTIGSKLVGLNPVGNTPISYTLSQVVEQDLAGLPANVKKHVVLISDGRETCGADPCRVMTQFVRDGISMQVDVIGFGLNDDGAEQQLRCVSAATYGKFWRADTAAQLADTMSQAARREVQATIVGQ